MDKTNNFSFKETLKNAWAFTQKNIGFMSSSLFFFIVSIFFLPLLTRIFISPLNYLLPHYSGILSISITIILFVLLSVVFIQGMMKVALGLVSGESPKKEIFMPNIKLLVKFVSIIGLILLAVSPFLIFQLSFLTPLILPNFGFTSEGMFVSPILSLEVIATMLASIPFFPIFILVGGNSGIEMVSGFTKLLTTGLFTVILPLLLILSRVVFSLFILIEGETSITASIKRSLYLTKGLRLKLLSFFSLCFLVLLPISGFGITLFFVIPFIFITLALVYRKLKELTYISDNV